MSAFQQLGPFISTFADADKTGLYVNEDGSLSFRTIARLVTLISQYNFFFNVNIGLKSEYSIKTFLI